LSKDQGNSDAQLNHDALLDRGETVTINKSLAAHFFKFSADQRMLNSIMAVCLIEVKIFR
jgi:TPR repeat protein